MKMFELVPYILELDPETEIKLIEDLEPGKDGLPIKCLRYSLP